MKKISFQNLISANQISQNDIDLIFGLATNYQEDLKQNKIKKYSDLEGVILATLFFEPSSRTRFSFEGAMMRLGGNLISLENGLSSAAKKGESLSDMGRIIGNYADLVIIRHSKNDSALEFSSNCEIPVINGGDGSNEHPTQSLTDLFTIKQDKARLDNLKIGFVGDLKYGRTIYSLVKLLNLYPNNKFYLISHKLSQISTKRREAIEKINGEIIETEDLGNTIKDLDILYVTRIQKERFEDEKEYQIVKNKYQISTDLLKKGKKDLSIMHPLPRVDEIDIEVDSFPQAKYFTQAQNSLFIRMALLKLLTDKKYR
jgi:aspartate carbamoyltransferase catalytic subunit